jgi:plasmid stability protein
MISFCSRKGINVAQVLVRNLPDEVHRALRVRAANNGRSAAAELRHIVMEAVLPRTLEATKVPLRERLMALTKEADLIAAGVPVDPRSDNEILGYNKNGIW